MARRPEIAPEDNPLSFLDRLLDEERDTNKYLGDIRFWRDVEYMDTNHIYRTKSIEYRQMKMMFCEAMFYLMFLFVLSGFIIEQRSNSLYESRRQQLDYWGDCRVTRAPDGTKTRKCTMDDVKDPVSLTAWLRSTFVPKAFDKELYPAINNATASIYRLQGGTPAWMPRYVGDTKTSVLVGAVRLRQLRVFAPSECSVIDEFKDLEEDCLPQFSEGYQSKQSWAPTWTPTYLKVHYRWWSRNKTNQAPMQGLYGSYPGDGFVLDMPLNLTGAVSRLNELEEWQWFDERTRAVILELSTLNLNVNMFVHSRILFEFPATGGAVARQEAFAFRAIQLSLRLMATDSLTGAFLFFIWTSALHLLLFFYTIYLIYKNGFRFFAYFWSWCDLLILLFFAVWLGITASIWAWTEEEPNLQPEVIADPELLFPVGKVVGLLDTQAAFLAALGLVSWLKIIKYFSLVDMFHAFVRVIERCIVNLLCFTGLLFVVLFGFAVAFHIAYGDENNLFFTMKGSFVAVMVAPAGGVDFSPVFDRDDMLGPVLIFAYIIVIILLLLNTFMAICVDTYSVCAFEIGEVYRVMPEHPTSIFVWTYFNALKGTKLVGRETEEEKGADDEQGILLSSLPEPIQVKYMETRGRMQALLDSAERQILEKKLEALMRNGALEPEEVAEKLRDHDQKKRALAIKDAQGAKPLAITDSQPAPGKIGNSMMSEDEIALLGGGMMDEEPPAPEDPTGITVNRVQLQRMLEEDFNLQEITGTNRAIDVVRRFRVDQSGVDPYEAVANLQAAVTAKLKDLQDRGVNLTFNETEMLKSVSQELHSSLTESQKEWRAELLTIMQMSNLLSSVLIDLTRKLETVQKNHNQLAMRAKGN